MFGFSFWEISIILVIALLVIGPERLPKLARTLGEWTYKTKKFLASAKADLDSEFNLKDMHHLLNAQESEISKLRAMVEETRQDVSESGNTLLGAIDDAGKTVKDAGKQTEAAVKDDAAAEPADKAADPAADNKATKASDIDDASEDEVPASERVLSLEEEIAEFERESGKSLERPFSRPVATEQPNTADPENERSGRDQSGG